MFTEVFKKLKEELEFSDLLHSTGIGKCLHSVIVKGECVNCQEEIK